MSAKTCQLCGKPLGRMRGSDGEFCSREHRNQFRLRRGMDRLEEANKVASLMRRRENPRQIPPEQLAAAGMCEPRTSPNPAPFPVRPVEPRFNALTPALFQAHIPQNENGLSNPVFKPSLRSAASDALMAPAVLPFVARRAVPTLESKGTKPPAGVVRANAATLRYQFPGTKGGTRECQAVLQFKRRPVPPRRDTALPGAGAAALEKSRKLQILVLDAVGTGDPEIKGYPGRAFAKRSPVMRTASELPALRSGLPEPKPRPGTRPEIKEIAPLSRACDIPRTLGTPRLPQLRATITVSGTQRSGISAMRPAPFACASLTDPRWCSMRWDAVSGVVLRRMPSRALGAGFDKAARPVDFHVPSDAFRNHRPAQVAFAPTDSPFEPAPISLHGVFPAPGAESGRSPLEVIEEHFDAGLEQWTGDTVDWKLDAAGARPAGLALFKPTVTLGDYEFEFFTRIENRAVNFAFRAANVSNYFKITIAMVESGRYELRRCAVIGGIEEPAASSPLPGVLRPGAAFTVRTRASQNDFIIWLDGELAAKWTDGRLPTGGIGFMAPRDDRARVYWVRLSQIEGPNSPAASHRPLRSIQ